MNLPGRRKLPRRQAGGFRQELAISIGSFPFGLLGQDQAWRGPLSTAFSCQFTALQAGFRSNDPVSKVTGDGEEISTEHRVEALFLSHRHPFYQSDTPEDSERRAYHEGVIALDLRGQREFNWGHVFCRFTLQVKCDWLESCITHSQIFRFTRRRLSRYLPPHEPVPHGAT